MRAIEESLIAKHDDNYVTFRTQLLTIRLTLTSFIILDADFAKKEQADRQITI